MMKRIMVLITAMFLLAGMTSYAEPTPMKVSREEREPVETAATISRKNYEATSDPALVVVSVEDQAPGGPLRGYTPTDLFDPPNVNMPKPEGLLPDDTSGNRYIEYSGYEERDAGNVSFTVNVMSDYVYARIYKMTDCKDTDTAPYYEYEWTHVEDIYHGEGDVIIQVDMSDGVYRMEDQIPSIRYAVVYEELHELMVVIDVEDGTGDIKTDQLTPDGCLPNVMNGPVTIKPNGTEETFEARQYYGYLEKNTSLVIPVKEVPGYYAEVYRTDDYSLDGEDLDIYDDNWYYVTTLYFEDGFRDDEIRALFYGNILYTVIYKPKTYWVGFATLDANGQPNASDETLNAHPNGSVTLPTGPAEYQYDADNPLSLILALDDHYQVEAWYAYFYTYIPDSEGSERELKEITDVSMLSAAEGSIVIDGSVISVDDDVQYMAKRDAYDYSDVPFMIYAELKSTTATTATEPDPTTTTTEPDPTTTTTTTTKKRSGTTTTTAPTTEAPTTSTEMTLETITVTETSVPQAVTLQEIIAQEIPQTGGLPMAAFSLGGTALLGLGLLLKRKK